MYFLRNVRSREKVRDSKHQRYVDDTMVVIRKKSVWEGFSVSLSVVSREEQADLEHCVLNTLITGLSELSSLERSTCYQKKKKV